MTGPVPTEALVERLRRISAKWAIFSDERGLVSGLATEAADALQQVTAERDAAIKTCEMAAMSGGFYARHAESAETRANRAKVAHDTATSELARLRAEGEAKDRALKEATDKLEAVCSAISVAAEWERAAERSAQREDECLRRNPLIRRAVEAARAAKEASDA